MSVATTPFAFDRSELAALARAHSDDFRTSAPFPHVIVDDFLPAPVVDRVLAEFPAPEHAGWQRFTNSKELKLASNDVTQMGPVTRQVLAEFNGQVFVDFLEELTGIDGLIPDPHYVGGGLHQIGPGGFLKIHADFNRHKRLQLDRRLNALIYLNPDWGEEYGGHFEAWDQRMDRCAAKVLPVLNRFVVFATTDGALHGHPEPLTCPPDRTRRSMALYYYSNGRPEHETSAAHTTLFHERPEDREKRTPLREAADEWLPPAVLRWARHRRRALRRGSSGQE